MNNKKACIVGAGEYSGVNCLVKVRDRNYVPAVRIIRDIIDGVEVAYLHDIDTDWSEGINEYGIGVVSSALMVIEDETVKKERTNAPDGVKIRKMLTKTTLGGAVSEGVRVGVTGHTLISTKSGIIGIEQDGDKPEILVLDSASGAKIVRTNHGELIPEAGYTKGPDLKSSLSRRRQAERWLNQAKTVDDLAPSITRRRLKDRTHPHNMIRNIEGAMMSSNLTVVDSTNVCLKMYLIPGRVDFCGIVNRLPKGYRPKIKLEFYEYYNWNRKYPSLRKLKNKDLKSLWVFVYGSLMSDIPYKNQLLSKQKATVKAMCRSFNKFSTGRGHYVCGTKPGGSMDGLLLEYPMDLALKILNSIDRREGFQYDRDEEINSYVRTTTTATTDKSPDGIRCVIYLTNEEHKGYTGEYKVREMAKGLVKGKGHKYLKDIHTTLSNLGCSDPYIDKLYGKAVEYKEKDVEQIEGQLGLE